MTELEDRLQAAYAAGRLRFGDLGLELREYQRRTELLAERRLKAWSIAPTAEAVLDHLRRMALEDLYLTLACDGGDPRAWSRFQSEYGPRLVGLAVRRGADRTTAEQCAADLTADLAVPPPGREARALIGTFDGAGSLFGWLAVILGRRVARSAGRRSGPAVLPLRQDDEAEPGSRSPDPAEGVAAKEASARLLAALAAAWGALTPSETLSLLARYRDGWRQREIARLLRVSESRVSRIVASAEEKLGREVRRRFSGEAAFDASTWHALRATLSQQLSRTEVQVPPPSGGPSAQPGVRS